MPTTMPSDQQIATEAPKSSADALPSLTTYTAESEDDREDGLRLIADSVAQQRQIASRMLIFHPVNIAAFLALLAVVSRYLWNTYKDPLVIGTTIGGLAMTALVAVRGAAGAYIGIAETINWDWLGEDKLIVVKWGEEIIGALALGWADDESAKKKGHKRRRGKAVIRGWTVRVKYRGQGIGEGLLEEAVKLAGEKGADGIVFDPEHANSKRILPAFYDGYLDQRDQRAEKTLERVADEKGNFRQRRSSPTWGSR